MFAKQFRSLSSILFNALIITLIIFMLFAPVASASTLGDVNNDGRVDVQDVTLVMRHVLGIETLTTAQQAAADVNSDGSVNVQDVSLITQKSLGLIVDFPGTPIGLDEKEKPEPKQGTIISGNLTSNTVWTKEESPYFIVDDFQVFDDIVLIIQEGVSINVYDNVTFKVAGQLNILGSDTLPVKLMSVDQNWIGIEFINSNSTIQNAYFEGAKRALIFRGVCDILIEGNLFIDNNNIITDFQGYQEMIFKNNTVMNSDSVFHMIRTLGESIFVNNEFINNENVFHSGFYFGEVFIENNNFINNPFVVEAPSEDYGYGTMHIANNWWGTTDLQIIESLIKDKNDDVSLQHLEYLPIRTSKIEKIGSSIDPNMF